MIKYFSILIFTFGIFLTANISAQPELDATFGSGGKMVIDFNANSSPTDMVIQADNKIVLAGSCLHGFYYINSFCIVRRNEDGSPDLTFNPAQFGGYNLHNVPVGSSGGKIGGLTLQNEKIVASGSANISNQNRIVLVRYNVNGTIDTNFGTNGVASAGINGVDVITGHKVVTQPDGKILVVGQINGVQGQTPYRQIVTRFNADGSSDTAFGTNGFVLINPTDESSGLSIELQPDGKILTGGSVRASSPTPTGSYLITRLNSDGTFDSSFDGDGFVTIPFGTSWNFEYGIVSLAVQVDGRILALGDKNILYRLNKDGSLDTGFDGDGSRTAISGTAVVFEVAVTPSGKITVVGHTPVPQLGSFPTYYKVSRFLPNGSADTTFSDNGFLDIDTTVAIYDGATAVGFSSQGKVLIAGKAAPGVIGSPWVNSTMTMARLNAPAIQNVGVSGRVTNLNGKPVSNALITLQNGTEIIARGRTNPFGYFRFQNIPTAQTYTISTTAKGLKFYERRILVDDAISDFNIFGE